jgi:hypothetical protein
MKLCFSFLPALSAVNQSSKAITVAGVTVAYAAKRAIPHKRRNDMDMKKLEQELAERQSYEVIRNCPKVLVDGREWYDTTNCNVYWEVKYLRMRGHLMHHPKPHLVALSGKHEKEKPHNEI